MKTVIDAVNEFKGVWDSKYGTCLWYYRGNEKYIFGNSAYGENLVCTQKEFNKCVDEMSKAEWMEAKPPSVDNLVDDDSRQARVSNIGNVLHNISCSTVDEDEQNELGMYASYLWDLSSYFGKVDTGAVVIPEAKPTIDWDNAPEWATHYDTTPDIHPWLKLTGSIWEYWHIDKWLSYGATYSSSDECIIERPKAEAKPIYTQAMADAGELPSVGELVQMRRDFGGDNNFYNGKLIHEHNGVLWFVDDKYGGNLHSMNEVTFKPLIPLIDGEAYQFDYHDMIGIKGIYQKPDHDGFDSFVGSFGSVSKSMCSNIKHLTVK
jgi:hypothetical protein